MHAELTERGSGRPRAEPLITKPARRTRKPRRLSKRVRRIRAVSLLLVFGLFVAALASYVAALTAPGSSPASTRTIEWISNDVPGGRALVLFVERQWYQRTAPPAGGTPAGGIPRVAAAQSVPPQAGASPAFGSTAVSGLTFASSSGSVAATAPLAHLPAPGAIQPIAANPLPEEGQWQTAGRLVGGFPAVRVAFLRPDPVHTTLVTGVMWLDMRLLRADLIPGLDLPGSVSSWPGLFSYVPVDQRNNLVATFNSGFLLRDSQGGWYGQGQMASPLVKGVASLVIYKNGTATVAQWGRDVAMNAGISAVRQNLHLIVDGGQINPAVATDNIKLWGKTLGNTTLVWRSGLGVTANGALVYAAGNKLSVKSLAAVLQRAGAVRAMELDINSKWTSANYYDLSPSDPEVVTPTKLLAGMSRPADRYLTPDERDFVAIFTRS